jgi:signal transduction histidine kinase/CheY-like chemotaxis protein
VFRLALALLLFAATLSAEASQPSLGGQIPFEQFETATLGLAGDIEGITFDARGRLLVLSDRLAISSGTGWNTVALPGGTLIRSVADGADGRIWAGAINELGYFEEDGDGQLRYRSLADQVPPEDRNFQDVWRCGTVGAFTFFICRDRVFRWDGKSFQVWRYPTGRRLYPVNLGNEIWFTHSETGLYRLTEAGPALEHPASSLPNRPPLWLERRDGALYGAGRSGIFRLGDASPISAPALNEFLEKNYVVSGLRLPSGELALSTLGGVAIVSADLRELRRVLSLEDGLPINDGRGLALDETEHLWIATRLHGLVRIDARPSAALFQSDRPTAPSGAVHRLVQRGGEIVAAGERGLFSIDILSSGPFMRPVPGSPSHVRAMLPTAHGLLLGTISDVRLWREESTAVVADRSGTSVSDFVPSLRRPEEVFVLEISRLSSLSTDADGLRVATLHELPQPAAELMRDASGNLWINSPSNIVFHFNVTTQQLSAIALGVDVRSESRGIKFAQTAERGFVLCGGAVFETGPGTMVRRLPDLPGNATIVRAVASAQHRKLYAIVERSIVPSVPRVSLCSLDLAASDARWEEWHLPALRQVGSIHALIEDDLSHDLWIGADKGVLRVNPLELHAAPRPRPVTLRVSGIPPSGELPYAGHLVTATVETPDFGLRGELAFQSRRRTQDAAAAWPAPSFRSVFEFQSLADGFHELEVRAIDTQGRTSEPAVLQFRVLPPWWRQRTAIAAYGVALLLAVAATIRLRERQIRRRNEELERTIAERTAELRKANAAKDEFLASISHEIRNPLNGVVGLAASINPAQLEPRTRVKFDYLKHCAAHLSSLLEDILDFSQLERGTFVLESRPFEVRTLLDSIAAITADQSAKAGRQVDIQVAPNVPPVLIGDAARLRQLLLNLVLNALKYGERGDVQLTVFARAQAGADCQVTFAVSDEGPGIPPEELGQLFQQFTRGSAAKRTRQSGSGIGLSICRAIAEKMGGRLWAESEVGHGSTFSFEISLPVGPAPSAPATAGQPPRWNVLIVEDEDYNRVALGSLLETAGAQLTIASNGTDALAEHRTGRFDLAFLDYDMPGLTGPEVARQLRQRGDTKLVIIGTTAFVTRDKHDECLRAGMNVVITKPITLEKIRAALAQVYGPQQSAPAVELAADTPRSPRETLQDLAARKGQTRESETTQFLQALNETAGHLADALRQQLVAPGAREAHKLVGQLSYVGARGPEKLARRLEAAIGTEQWPEARRLAEELEGELVRLRRELAER